VGYKVKFSVIVAAYNVAPYIKGCLQSISAQTYADFEVIVIDDCSTDETLGVAQECALADSRIRVVSQFRNSGSHVVRKRGVEMSTGDWVLFVDGDDELAPEALQTLAESGALGQSEMVYFWRDVVQDNPKANSEAGKSLEQAFNVDLGSLKGDEILAAAFSDSRQGRVLWTVISVAVSATLAKRAFGVMTDRRMGRMEDAYEFFVLADQCKSLEFVPRPLLCYHWGRGVTGVSRQSIETYEKHVTDVKQVLAEVQRYADEQTDRTAVERESVEWLARQLPEHISTELVLRVDQEQEGQGAIAFARVWGKTVAIGEIERLIHDRACDLIKDEKIVDVDDELYRLLDIRDMLINSSYDNDTLPSLHSYYDSIGKKTDDLLNQIMDRQRGQVQQPKTINPFSSKRLAIYCFYDANGHAASFIPHFLDDLMRNVTDLVVVVNGKLDTSSREMFEQYAQTIIVRKNEGLDVAAYRQALLQIGWKKLESFDEVICLNDTILGPIYPFSQMFREMSQRPVDFWGITAYAGEDVGEETIPTHLQAYWHAYRKTLVKSQAFHEYWEQMPHWTDYAEVTRKHEMALTPHFEELGFSWDSYVDWKRYAGTSSYPLLYMPMEIIRDERCPIFKRRSFFVPYEFTFDQTAGQPALDLFEYIRDYTAYDTNFIWDALLQSYNVDDLRRAMHLDYVLPSSTRNPVAASKPTSAFIFHIFFMDLLEDTVRYINNLPVETDLYITTTDDKIETIRQALLNKGVTHTPTFIPVKNRGRDVSALLVAARDVVLGGKYEVVGFAHDKKSSQNQDAGHHGSETQGFAYKLMENTLGSQAYIDNILTLFGQNQRLGMVSPPPPYHALYFAHTLPSDWGPDFGITRDLLEKRLHIHVPLDSAKATVSAIGSCYWFRTEALRPLFANDWKYEDFLPEGQMGGDGSISHAIERANGYVAQSQGFYPAWVMSDRYARIEVDSLFHTTNTLLRGMGPFRRGETLLQTARELGSDLSKKGRIRRKVRQGAHGGLKWVTHRFVLPLPEPVVKMIYTVGWAPINVYRHTRNKLTQALRFVLHR
jgi:rhamnosyltransferase